ncbi:hypothetical protein HDU67_002374, partial [Dinochytrium kinnereticum]
MRHFLDDDDAADALDLLEDSPEDALTDTFICDMLESDPGITWGGSCIGRAPIERQLERFHEILWNDYFAQTPRYDEKKFRRRFRMPSHLFLKIKEDVENFNKGFFKQQQDATGKKGLSCAHHLGVLYDAGGSAAHLSGQGFSRSPSDAGSFGATGGPGGKRGGVSALPGAEGGHDTSLAVSQGCGGQGHYSCAVAGPSRNIGDGADAPACQ